MHASDLNKSKLKKAFDFLSFRRWLISQIKKDNPDGLIILSTLTGVILGRFLYARSTRYIFDIRDYSYEHIKPFYKIEKEVIENSEFTAISSKGFEEFLPKRNYVIAHNFNRNDIRKGENLQKTTGKINFVWNGVVRYFEFQRLYLDALKNDERFEIVFHGDGPELEKYKNYCRNQGFRNVIFTGSYDNSLKNELLREANILNNCYGYIESAGSKLKYAVSNRFYDGVIYHIPQLVEPEGFKTEWVNRTGIGLSLSVDDKFADKLFDYYKNLEESSFDLSCDQLLQEIIKDDDYYIERIDRFIVKIMGEKHGN